MENREIVKSISGRITDVLRFSLEDGPGIRTTVFLKGCPLRCFWCHNPESLSKDMQLQYFEEKCTGCGDCVMSCPVNAQNMSEGQHTFNRKICIACGKCVDVCCFGALKLAGKDVDVNVLMKTIVKDRRYYETSGGGVTLSGGEPLMQPEFCQLLLKQCKAQGINTAIETCGYWDWQAVHSVIEFTDYFIIDIKAFNEKLHKDVTGVSNKRILENIKKISEAGNKIIIRTPVIPGVNDNEEEIQSIAGFVRDLKGVLTYELLPFHHMGRNKYKSLDMLDLSKDLDAPSKEKMDELRGYIG